MRFILSTAILLGLTACQPSTPAYISACEQTVRDYAVLRDDGPADQYADLFTQDGTFDLGGTITEGREALIARHKAANAAAAWRHNITDIRITKSGTDIKGVSRFIVMTGPHLGTASAEATREILGDYIDTFVMEDGVCRIKSRKVKIAFDTLYIKPGR